MVCIERFQRDIVEIRVYDPKNCTLPMPANLTFPVRSMENCIFTSPLLVMGVNNDTNPLDALATLKQKSTKKSSGTIWQHDLSASVKDNVDSVQSAIVGMETRHLYIVYKTEEGSYGLLYALPESAQLTCEVTDNTEHTLSVAYTCKSSYPAVVLTSPSFS